jgi:hypothetical protein
VKRSCTIFQSSEEYGSPFKRFVCVDVDNADEIFECIEKNRKRFNYILKRTLTQHQMHWDCYDVENRAYVKDVTAFKFDDRQNSRIYCKEVKSQNGIFYIICAVAHSKKVQRNDKRIDTIIEKISTYEYEIIE